MEAGCCGLTLLTGRQITLWYFILLTGNARELLPAGAVPHKRPLLFCGNAAAADLNDHPSHQTESGRNSRSRLFFFAQMTGSRPSRSKLTGLAKKSRMHLHSGFFRFIFHFSSLICTPPVFSHSTRTTARSRPSTSRLQLWQQRK